MIICKLILVVLFINGIVLCNGELKFGGSCWMLLMIRKIFGLFYYDCDNNFLVDRFGGGL